MAKWTKKQIAAGFGGKAAQTRQKNRKRKTLGYVREKKKTTTTKKRSGTMAKKKSGKKGAKKSHRRRGGGSGGALGMTSRETQIALGAAALYGTLQNKATESGEAGKTDMDWFRKAPTIVAIGRAGTFALVFYILHRMNVGRGYTKPIAIGLAAVALLQLAQRGFKLYEETWKDSAMYGGEDAPREMEGGNGQTHLSGRLPIDANHYERAAA